jgi:hypothetical protein
MDNIPELLPLVRQQRFQNYDRDTHVRNISLISDESEFLSYINSQIINVSLEDYNYIYERLIQKWKPLFEEYKSRE